ncbi:MAG TPA: ROK family protein [Actinophytocola sp.]|uniref:ROK family protein n=1 Tax=Actinophytocola sp. TaxID=1872138 RepID=UPI002DB82012|nr:ROK family protein [Actinophytocola sp.]HEU5469377.1 ROK family protein [Actinophytocola sp.]
MDYLGIDIGGTKVAFRLHGRDGERETVVRWPAGTDPANDLAALRRGLRAVAGRRPKSGPLSVGVAVPALLDPDGRVLTWPNRPGWRGIDLRGLFDRELPGVPVRFGDDGDLATLAEAYQAGRPDLLYLGVGTGVGGGLFLDGDLLRSDNGPVAEVGHIVVAPDGPPCRCGRRGCVQAIASGPATLRRAARADPTVTGSAALRSALAAGAPWAHRTVRETATALGTAVATVTELVRPAVVRLGGGFAAALPELGAATEAVVRALDRPGHPAPPVEPAAYGAASSLAGAVLLARRPGLLAAA